MRHRLVRASAGRPIGTRAGVGPRTTFGPRQQIRQNGLRRELVGGARPTDIASPHRPVEVDQTRDAVAAEVARPEIPALPVLPVVHGLALVCGSSLVWGSCLVCGPSGMITGWRPRMGLT